MSNQTMSKQTRSSRAPKSARSIQRVEEISTIVSTIGPKVKRLRHEQRLSLQQLALRSDVSTAAIHKIESNNMVPTVTTLLKIATALERPVGYFIDDEQPADPVAFTRASDRPAIYTPHVGLSLAGISGPYAPFRSAAAVATAEPGATSGEKPLVHPGEELVYVLEGSLEFDIAGTHYRVGRGDSLHFLGDQPHHWANTRATPARAIWTELRD
jgi:transcriptional regulator with XRE-family HTH domain